MSLVINPQHLILTRFFVVLASGLALMTVAILVQGLTMAPVLRHLGLAGPVRASH